MTKYNGITIPPAQDLPPAGFDAIAFRPMCSQLNYAGHADGSTHWNLNMPDGKSITLKKLSSNLSVNAAHETLNSAGLCKLGTNADGLVEVPIVYAHQIPKEAVPQLTAEVVEQQALPDAGFTRFPIESLMGGALLITGVLLIIHSVIGGKAASTNQAATKTDDLLQEIFNNAN